MEWKEVRLGDVLEVKYGKDHKKLADGIYPVYGSGGLMRHVDSKLYDGPSILIPRKGTLNNIMYAEKPFWTVDTMFWTIIDEKMVDPKYLFYSICKKDFASMNVGSAVPSMTVKILNELSISLPASLSDQRRISSLLSSFDRKIETNNRINAVLEEMAQAIFKSWFVDFEPFQDGNFVDSELGRIPEGWKVVELREIAEITMGQSPDGKSLNEKGEGLIFYQGCTDFGFRYPKIRVYTTGPHRIATSNSILFSVRAPVGYINIANKECCIGRGIAAIKSKGKNDSFLFYAMKSLNKLYESYNGEGTIFGSINKNTLARTKIVVPSNNIIASFNECVSTFDCRIKNLSEENRHLSSLRDTLLPRLMSGEIEIPE